MTHFEEIEVVAIMPATGAVYAHALGKDSVVYCYMPCQGQRNAAWQRVGSGAACWGKRMCIRPYRKPYRGKFIIKAWAE